LLQIKKDRKELAMTEESAAITNGIEARAAQMGHLPLDKFRGNPDNWVDAETFVRMAEESLPHAKGTIKMMERKMDQQARAMQEQADRIAAMQQDMQEFVQVSRGAEQRAYEKAKRELLAQQQTAKAEGDMPAFVEATERLDSLIAEQPTATVKDPKAGSTEERSKSPDDEYREWMAAEPTAYDDWKADNTWYAEDPDMFAYAQQMDQFLQTKHGFKLPRSKRLEELTKLVKKRFPDHFGNAARKVGSPVEGDSGGSPSSGGKTYNDLPPEAQKQCTKWTGKDGKGTSGTISGLTRADYLASYKW
jgi:hypothetical protein